MSAPVQRIECSPPECRKAAPPVLQQCWWNALAAAAWYEKRGDSVLYVEGWCVMREVGIAFQHGWLEVNGGVVEATSDTPQDDYFPAARYAPAFARKAIRAQGNQAPITGWPGKRDLHAFRWAMVLAHAKSLGQTVEAVDAFMPKLPAGGA